MRYMVVERFRNGDPEPVYARFRERGRMAPDGLRYVDSWVTEDLSCCFQIMECEDRSLLHEWIGAWADLVEFEVHPVVSSAEAAERARRSCSRAARSGAKRSAPTTSTDEGARLVGVDDEGHHVRAES